MGRSAGELPKALFKEGFANSMTRFPTYPKDILSRADALLSSKYPDGIVDPALVELLCKMAVEERERCAVLAETCTVKDDWAADIAKAE
jgi:hypothetical protein